MRSRPTDRVRPPSRATTTHPRSQATHALLRAAAPRSRARLRTRRASGDGRSPDGARGNHGGRSPRRGDPPGPGREGALPPVETEVLLTYDDTNLYVAFIARDPNPQQIRATLQPRDQLWADDWVGVLLDPVRRRLAGLLPSSNPIGVQGDMQMTPQARTRPSTSSTHGRADHRRRVRRGDGDPVPQPARPRPRRAELGDHARAQLPALQPALVSWPHEPATTPASSASSARLEGIEGIRTGGNLEVLPSLVASQAGRLAGPRPIRAPSRAGGCSAEPSLGLKYVFRSGWTAEATLNPDFSQVESDAAQVDVNTTFALFYPERRPFFQEGMDLYRDADERLLLALDQRAAGGHEADRPRGRTSIGYIGARDEHTPFILPFEERSPVPAGGTSFTNVLRLQHNLRRLARGRAPHRPPAGRRRLGTTASVDGQYRFGEMYSVSGHLVLSHTREPDDPELSARLPDLTFGSGDRQHTAAFDGESFGGHAAQLYLARDARTWSWNLLYMEASPTYRADAGFQTRTTSAARPGGPGSRSTRTVPSWSGSPPPCSAGATGTSRGPGRRRSSPGDQRHAAAADQRGDQHVVLREELPRRRAHRPPRLHLWLNSNFSAAFAAASSRSAPAAGSPAPSRCRRSARGATRASRPPSSPAAAGRSSRRSPTRS
jgi:hypothetical protein